MEAALLAAALVGLLLLLVGCGVAYAQGWFAHHFTQESGDPLSPGQMDYLAQNEQLIGESQVQNQWTVELRSAINDGTEGMVILGVTAPEGVSLEPVIEDDHLVSWLSPGNGGRMGWQRDVPPVISASEGIDCWGIGGSWEEDGDGLINTKNYVLKLQPNRERSTVDPFGPTAEYYIHIENIVRESDDEEYKQSLLNGKYAGQTDVMFESDEVLRMWKRDILAEGTWDFTIRFNNSSQEVELLSKPMMTMGYAYREGPPLNKFLNDTIESYEKIKITSFVLRPLGATIFYECDVGVNFTIYGKDHIYAVMKDGSQIELEDFGSGGDGYASLEPVSPIVLNEVDHILMADGTVIPMP